MNPTLKNTLESSDNIQYDIYLSWLTEATVRGISADQGEPEWMLEHRLKSFALLQTMSLPLRWPDLSGLDLSQIVYYARPSKEFVWAATSWDDVPEEIKQKFDRLGIPEAERSYLAWAGGQYDSENVYHNLKAKRADKGVIFEDMAHALQSHPELVHKYFMKLVPMTDHYFAALHGAVCGHEGPLSISHLAWRWRSHYRHISVWIRMEEGSLSIRSSLSKMMQ